MEIRKTERIVLCGIIHTQKVFLAIINIEYKYINGKEWVDESVVYWILEKVRWEELMKIEKQSFSFQNRSVLLSETVFRCLISEIDIELGAEIVYFS